MQGFGDRWKGVDMNMNEWQMKGVDILQAVKLITACWKKEEIVH